MTMTESHREEIHRGTPSPEAAARVIIADVRPHLGEGRYAIKRIVGDRLRVTAAILK